MTEMKLRGQYSVKKNVSNVGELLYSGITVGVGRIQGVQFNSDVFQLVDEERERIQKPL